MKPGVSFASSLSAFAHAQPPLLEVQAVAETGSMPKGVSISPDGKHAYVTNFGRSNGKNIDVHNAETLAHESTIDVMGNVVESVPSADDQDDSRFELHPQQRAVHRSASKRVTKEITVGLHPKILVPTADGQFLFAANWSGQSVRRSRSPPARSARCRRAASTCAAWR